MKKIMFNDKHSLTKAVLEGRKTMTRRMVPDRYVELANGMEGACILEGAHYKVGEVVAVAQRYKDIIGDRVFFVSSETGVSVHRSVMEREKGWTNKMNVAAEFMPHRIRITDIKVERLQDISDEDCVREGVMSRKGMYRSKARPFYFEGGKHSWDNTFRTARQAFAALIDKVSGKDTWERNPWVFAYSFELVEGDEE